MTCGRGSTVNIPAAIAGISLDVKQSTILGLNGVGVFVGSHRRDCAPIGLPRREKDGIRLHSTRSVGMVNRPREANCSTSEPLK